MKHQQQLDWELDLPFYKFMIIQSARLQIPQLNAQILPTIFTNEYGEN